MESCLVSLVVNKTSDYDVLVRAVEVWERRWRKKRRWRRKGKRRRKRRRRRTRSEDQMQLLLDGAHYI